MMRASGHAWRLLTAAGLAIGAATIAPDRAAAQDAACTRLGSVGFTDTRVLSARPVAADPARKLPAFCEIKAVISAVQGSRIGVVYRLPAEWNGKLLGLGGGGMAGNVQLNTAAPGLSRGYATAQTDGGHENPDGADSAWTVRTDGHPDMVALEDFGHRALHSMTVVAKEVVANYYGRPQNRAYYQGCSTGGRQGLMEVQRYPADYDGVIAGAPVYSLRVQAAEIWRENIFAQPGAALLPAHIPLIQAASLKACDELDGLKDGIVTDPRACRWDPAELQCRDGASGPTCLTPAQVAAIRKAYTTVATPSGEAAVYRLGGGSEAAWGTFTKLTAEGPSRSARRANLREAYFGDPNFNLAGLDPARDVPKMRTLPLARVHEAADPDISAFVNRGGKLILWHGFDDPGPSALHTLEYYDAMQATTGGKVGRDRLGAAVRFYLAPGVHHCRGGPGPDVFDTLTALDRWVEQGVAPERIVATKAGSSISRPLCPYPALPYYRREGDPNDERSFVCR